MLAAETAGHRCLSEAPAVGAVTAPAITHDTRVRQRHHCWQYSMAQVPGNVVCTVICANAGTGPMPGNIHTSMPRPG